ncbi:MAG: DNA recombination protein RmuC [Chromatiales bacterium]|jgi:DNA recombination protein RmuC|nr:MAG: DNA recombination protein RmuC [Chromatiales bacterium]
MNSFTLDPLYLTIGVPALALGLILGVVIALLIGRSRQKRMTEERESAFELANARLTQTFAELSNRSLQANSDTFLKLAEQRLGTQQEKAKSELSEREKAVEALVKPINDALKASLQQISELEKSRSEAYGGIKNQLEEMQLNQKSLRQETQNLVNALRRPEVRGRWGEITLRRLVELAGMVEHCDFVEQVHTEADGQIFRPDMVVRMPDQRELIVDVKTPLDAYLAAAEAPDDVQRKLGLERHAKNVRAHIRMLASKAYWNQFDESPEFVILFIPGDQFLSAALNEQPDLIEYALSKQIILATPTSFVALLKAVAYGWRQMSLADNAKEIRVLAEDLYGRLATFVSHLNKVGRQLAGSVENYNKAVGSLERSVLPGARKFVELGVHPSKEIEKLESLEPVPRTLIEGNDI